MMGVVVYGLKCLIYLLCAFAIITLFQLLLGVPFLTAGLMLKQLDYDNLLCVSVILLLACVLLLYLLRREKKERQIDILLLRWCIKDGGIKIPANKEEIDRIVTTHVKYLNEETDHKKRLKKVSEYEYKRRLVEKRLFEMLHDFHYVDNDWYDINETQRKP